MIQIESLLSARLFMSPQRVGDRIYFVSNLSGRLSLYAMNYGGSVPEPLLPPDIALQNPTLVGGKPFYVFPKAGADRGHAGSKRGRKLSTHGSSRLRADIRKRLSPGLLAAIDRTLSMVMGNTIWFISGAESMEDATVEAIQGRLGDKPELTRLASSPYGNRERLRARSTTG